MTDQARAPTTRRKVLEAMRAVLSDDHNYERGLATLRDLVDQVARDEGATGLADLTVALSLELAQALEEIARDQGLAAADPVHPGEAEEAVHGPRVVGEADPDPGLGEPAGVERAVVAQRVVLGGQHRRRRQTCRGGLPLRGDVSCDDLCRPPGVQLKFVRR